MPDNAIVNCILLEVLGKKEPDPEPVAIVNTIVLEVLGKVD